MLNTTSELESEKSFSKPPLPGLSLWVKDKLNEVADVSPWLGLVKHIFSDLSSLITKSFTDIGYSGVDLVLNDPVIFSTEFLSNPTMLCPPDIKSSSKVYVELSVKNDFIWGYRTEWSH